MKGLDQFNFGNSLKTWMGLFQIGSETCILQNDFMSKYFSLKRGCIRGDPISPCLFTFCAELLGKNGEKNMEINGMLINGKENKLSQYAGDTQSILDGTEKSSKTPLNLLNNFIQSQD